MTHGGFRRLWTREEGIAALRDLGQKLGRTPTARDMGAGRCPSTQFFLKYFGSLTAAQRAAGLAPCRKGPPKGSRRPVGADWRITLPVVDPVKAQEITEAKKAHWCSAERSDAAPKHGLLSWVHPYARRSA